MSDCNVIYVGIAENGQKRDWRRVLTTLNVYLTIGVLVDVFRYDDSRQLTSDMPFPLCYNARKGHAPLVFLETSGEPEYHWRNRCC